MTIPNTHVEVARVLYLRAKELERGLQASVSTFLMNGHLPPPHLVDSRNDATALTEIAMRIYTRERENGDTT